MDFLQNLVAWVLFGALAGWLSSKLMHVKTSFWFNVAIGIVGAIIGGGIVRLLGGSGLTGFNVYSLIVAVLGACLLTWALRKYGGKETPKL